MNRTVFGLALGAFVVSVQAFAVPGTISGTITEVRPVRKEVVLKEANGRDTTFLILKDTKVEIEDEAKSKAAALLITVRGIRVGLSCSVTADSGRTISVECR